MTFLAWDHTASQGQSQDFDPGGEFKDLVGSTACMRRNGENGSQDISLGPLCVAYGFCSHFPLRQGLAGSLPIAFLYKARYAAFLCGPLNLP